MPTFEDLDNPIWAALTTRHAGIARTSGRARRYSSDVSPLSGLSEPTPAAFTDLSVLVGPGEHAGLMTFEPLQVPGDWEVGRSRPIAQMICTELKIDTGRTIRTVPPRTSSSIPVALGASDVPEMLALAAATEPGPFLPETIRMGRYFGTRSGDGRLIAMAGERLKLNGFTEISAVCTDPEFRGQGHARALVELLVAQTLAEGNVPFLHVKEENGAKLLYEKIGFRVRRVLHLTVIGR